MAKNNPLIVIITAFLVLSLMLSLVKAAPKNITTDQHALLALKDRIKYDPTNLLAKNWTTSSSICTWIGVTCGVRHHRVTGLNISNFGLAGTLPPQLGNLSSLRVLDLSVNQLSGTIPSSIFQISSLERLDLSYNQLSDSFPSIIFNLPSLQVIHFKSNSLSGGLPSHIFNYLPNLKMLHLSANMFDGQIPSTISKCQQLQILSLFNNNFTGYIPKEIGNLTMLKELYLADNKLQGEIPHELSNLVKLNVAVVALSLLLPPCSFEAVASPVFSGVWLEATNITTDQSSSLLAFKAHITNDPHNLLANYWTASTSVCNWVGITCDSQNNRVIVLNLTSMSLTSTIPLHIGNLSFLDQLHLRNNSFHGSLPVDIVHLRRLEILHLGYNTFQGEIPSWLGSAPCLNFKSCISFVTIYKYYPTFSRKYHNIKEPRIVE
ncbi:hypothetical protein EZV62_026895 [Acer yangbiense]|uniref:Leucine-rich repeat-containing N-terminal plant-type domain-containing protein n=1 Tax=Acer yangbiense TaxID=1000413 RepID=A0A5C7GS57_9ROSI|nr:hypothetical protein EZV62_026895 [Acer yangbiense]